MPKIFILTIIFTFFFSRSVYSSDDIVSDLTSKINEYNQKLNDLNRAKDTLSNQIKILNSQAQLTILKINQTEINIKILKSEIANLTTKINELDISLNRLSSLFIEQVAQNYKLYKRYPKIQAILSSNFNKLLEQYKYIVNIQKNNQNTLFNLETVRTNYDNQKIQKSQKQKELETLEQKLSEQKISLSKQLITKNNLLEITKNDEKKYQQLKKATEEELSSLLTAKFVGKRTVKAGEALGLMGNTGYSFGDHLHFGLYLLKEEQINQWVYVNDIDSTEYLNKHMWPMNNPIEITQNRGVTKYSYLYADHFHHGVDMVAPNKMVRSVADGVAYFFRNSNSSLGNHVKLFDNSGYMTLYLHLQ